jgi:hypothetical protein
MSDGPFIKAWLRHFLLEALLQLQLHLLLLLRHNTRWIT